MEQWQLEALHTLMQTPVHEVEAGERVYLSSVTYGTSRYHLVNKRHDGVQIEQVNTEEKWRSRVNLQRDEVSALLKTLLVWYLADLQAEQARASSPADDAPF